ncbi:MAG: hypothetical protein EON54_26690 [Alcaligenaceae bacterium]|nr:MAG: hypothetical protein EON54_26690 [Alcaligenaceae bacterium]
MNGTRRRRSYVAAAAAGASLALVLTACSSEALQNAIAINWRRVVTVQACRSNFSTSRSRLAQSSRN